MHITTDIAELAKQEERLLFDSFDNETAFRIGVDLKKAAEKLGKAVAIDVRAFGQVLFHHAMAGTAPDNDQWVERKSAVVLRFHRSSLRVGRELAEEGLSIAERHFVDPMSFSPFGGAFPIRLRSGGVIGAVTVSGLPQEEDHALVVSVLEAILH